MSGVVYKYNGDVLLAVSSAKNLNAFLLITISINFYRPQRSCEGYVFTPVYQSFCSQGREYLGRHPPGPGTHPPGPGAPLWAGSPLGPGTPPKDQVLPWDQVHPPGTRYTSRGQVLPAPTTRLLLRMVRILLKCILVVN